MLEHSDSSDALPRPCVVIWRWTASFAPISSWFWTCGPQLALLFGKVMKPLGGRLYFLEWVTVGGHLIFLAQPYASFHCLCPTYSYNETDLSVAMMDSISLNYKSKATLFQVLVRLLVRAMKTLSNIASKYLCLKECPAKVFKNSDLNQSPHLKSKWISTLMFVIASMFSVDFTPKTWQHLCLLNWSNTYLLGRDMVGGGTDVA